MRPIPAHAHVYDRLYAEYKTLYNYFGRGANDVMTRLRTMRREARAAVGQAADQRESLALPDSTEQRALGR
jgi:L-ribulokinase